MAAPALASNRSRRLGLVIAHGPLYVVDLPDVLHRQLEPGLGSCRLPPVATMQGTFSIATKIAASTTTYRVYAKPVTLSGRRYAATATANATPTAVANTPPLNQHARNFKAAPRPTSDH